MADELLLLTSVSTIKITVKQISLSGTFHHTRYLFYFQFEFINCFISLFYVAFYLQDMTLLRSVSKMCSSYTIINEQRGGKGHTGTYYLNHLRASSGSKVGQPPRSGSKFNVFGMDPQQCQHWLVGIPVYL